MDVIEIRRRNIAMLVAKAGGPTLFGKKIERDQAQVSQWLSEGNPKAVGRTLARHIEKRLRKPHGWLDLPQWHDSGVIAAVSGIGETPAHYAVRAEHRVPVQGTAMMDKDGFWSELVDDPLGNGYFEIGCDDPDAYFIRIKGGVSTPLALSGWYILLLPNLDPRPGDHVVVCLKGGRSMIKEFLWHRDGEYALQAGDGSRVILGDAEVDYVHCMAGTMMPNQLKRD